MKENFEFNNLDLTRNYYNGIAKGYSKLYHHEQIKKISIIKDDLKRVTGRILDLGAGDGVLNKFISKSAILYSLDLSLELLKLNPNIEKYKFLGNCEDLEFDNDYFNYIFSFTVFQDLQNPKKAISEAYRVLKSGGIFYLSFLNISSKADIIKEELFKYFKVIKKIKEEKDYIFILKK